MTRSPWIITIGFDGEGCLRDTTDREGALYRFPTPEAAFSAVRAAQAVDLSPYFTKQERA